MNLQAVTEDLVPPAVVLGRKRAVFSRSVSRSNDGDFALCFCGNPSFDAVDAEGIPRGRSPLNNDDALCRRVPILRPLELSFHTEAAAGDNNLGDRPARAAARARRQPGTMSRRGIVQYVPTFADH